MELALKGHLSITCVRVHTHTPHTRTHTHTKLCISGMTTERQYSNLHSKNMKKIHSQYKQPNNAKLHKTEK